MSRIIIWSLCFFNFISFGKQKTIVSSPKKSNCPQTLDNVLNVHFIPHTHDDVGWLKTVDQYYYGTKKDVTIASVQAILDSVVEALLEDKNRRFIYVEIAFFWRWWNEQSEHRKIEVEKLVNEGRLEFINGGWSMNDEAAAHYNAIIDQMSLGLRFLNNTFGPVSKPKIAWQIDPFGHSKEQANLFHEMGFKGLYFARVDHADFDKRKKGKTLEMIWEGRPNGSRLFTGILPNHYVPPTGFCFDIFCNDDSIEDESEILIMNQFLNESIKQSSYFKTNNLPMTMGGDFQYTDAFGWFKNMDKIISYFSDRKKLNVVYSTPSCYMEAVLKKLQIDYPIKKDDFFPYSMDTRGYWTGYFSSRPSLKRMIRFSNNILQACKQLNVLADLHSRNVYSLMRAVAVGQHHDAITGTARQHVTNDYLHRLSIGVDKCYEVIKSAVTKLNYSKDQEITFCPLLNITECQFTSQSKRDFYVTIYNPLSHYINYTARFPANGLFHYNIEGIDESVVFPVSRKILNIPGRKSYSSNESIVYFEATNIPPMSFQIYKVNVGNESRKNKFKNEKITISSNDQEFKISLILDPKGNIEGIDTPLGKFPLSIKMGYYVSSIGGAYVFKPLNQEPTILKATSKPFMRESNYITEIEIEFSNWASAIVRVNNYNEYLEIEWLVGPIPIVDVGKNVIIKYRCKSIHSNESFYTDSNGRQFMKRRKDYRATWPLDLNLDPVSRNYYPITSTISVEDDLVRMSVLTDRSQGGTSLNNGEIELMLHRRLMSRDGFGVGEPLNEVAYGKGLVCIGKHYLVFEESSSRVLTRKLALQTYDDAILSFSNKKPQPPKDYPIKKGALPLNVHILSLEKHFNGIIVRFEHFFDVNEDLEYSKSVTFNILNVFNPRYLSIKTIRELSLGGDEYLSDIIRDFDILLEPMEIRTYLIN
ncbi:LOW QUALITY PROTEIN: lysosomal alpha-mannosidase [Lepeophtheirus salmonis]|uniref:LOW QUALITY PROTEIN: lysosomal alpha-mannosidase n=1 Tax=Lepeophtheirus salmonis TaxID=72036 RepID=UPI003AF38305